MKNKIAKRIFGGLLAAVLVVAGMPAVSVEAGLADDAKDYELGETYTGEGGYGHKIYKFEVDSKSHVSFEIMSEHDDDSWDRTVVTVYDEKGDVVISDEAFMFERNVVDRTWKSLQFRVLKQGTYFIDIYCEYPGGKYSLFIQSEPQITMGKGKITSKSSQGSGKVSVGCETVSDAEGYRFQISRSRKFTTGVKTVYSITNSASFSGLTRGKVYYVRVAPYAMYSDGEYAMGQNSLVRSIKVK